jgi:lipopolysaccharide/colanic/teichoic acid biosynthesis glycosyltransferase
MLRNFSFGSSAPCIRDNPGPTQQVTARRPTCLYNRVLAKTRKPIDELPQFFNVSFTDHMSVVKPRLRLAVQDVQSATIHHNYRAHALVKPRVTGFVQVQRFRRETAR